MNTIEDNKDIQLLKKEMWMKKTTTAEVTIIWKKKVVEETTLLEEIQKNSTKEQEFLKELERDEEQVWEDDGIFYMERRIYIPNNQKIQEQILWENYNPADVEYPEYWDNNECLSSLRGITHGSG